MADASSARAAEVILRVTRRHHDSGFRVISVDGCDHKHDVIELAGRLSIDAIKANEFRIFRVISVDHTSNAHVTIKGREEGR